MTLLKDAEDAALEGRVQVARSLSVRALHNAIVNRDRLQELTARLHLSELLISLGVGAEAAAHSRAAAESLTPQTPPLLRVKALVGWSYAASFIGDGSSALRSSAEALECANSVGDVDLRALASNYLGVANMWDGRWDAASDAYSASRLLVPGNSRPFLNAAANELLRTTVSVTLEGARIAEQVGAQRAKLAINDSLSRPVPLILGVVAVSSDAAASFFRSIVASWRRDPTVAEEALLDAREHLARGGARLGWMQPYLPWADCELAFMRGRYADAAEAATRVILEADKQGSEQAHWVGRLLRARCLHVMGEHARASHDWRYLWVRSMRRQSFVGELPAVRAPAFDSAPAPAPAKWATEFKLTSAETTIVQFLLDGHRLSDIAGFRTTSVGTTRSQLAAIFSKTGFKSQAQLVAGIHRY